MFKKHVKMITSVVAVAAMTAALALTASAASNVPEIATSAAIPTAATVIDGPSLEDISWLHATGASAFSFASDLDSTRVVSADDMAVIDRNAQIISMLVVKNGVEADVVYAFDAVADDGSILIAKADGVDTDVVFTGENDNPDAPIKIVFAEKMDNVIVTATDGIDLLKE